jgi:hypothetical protein
VSLGHRQILDFRNLLQLRPQASDVLPECGQLGGIASSKRDQLDRGKAI